MSEMTRMKLRRRIGGRLTRDDLLIQSSVGMGWGRQDLDISSELLEISQIQDQRDAALMYEAQRNRVRTRVPPDKLVRGN
jgi:capsular polysaccharide biosynthesis protein